MVEDVVDRLLHGPQLTPSSVSAPLSMAAPPSTACLSKATRKRVAERRVQEGNQRDDVQCGLVSCLPPVVEYVFGCTRGNIMGAL